MKIKNTHVRKIILFTILVLLSTSCFPVPTVTVSIPPAPTQTPPQVEMETQTPTASAEIKPATEEPEQIKELPTSTEDSVPELQPTPVSVDKLDPLAGIEMHQISNSGGLSLVIESGAVWVRRNALYWSQVEPSPGERRWNALANLEVELQNAATAGLQTILIVRSTPRWAQKLPWVYCGPVAEDAAEEFAQFMFDVVERYSKPPYNVLYWEIGNEPDVDSRYVKRDEIYGCWGDEDDEYYGGEYYASILNQVYPKVKQANPDAQVLLGGILLDCDPFDPPLIQGTEEKKDCSSALFLEGILKAGGGASFDGVSFHAYDYYWGGQGNYRNLGWQSSAETSGPVLIKKAEFIRETLNRYDVSDKFLMNTEVGILCGSTGKEKYCLTDEFRDTKAYYVAQSNSAAAAYGLRANVWYSIYGWRASGLALTSTTPTTALTAYSVNTSLLNESGFIRKLDEFPDVIGYEFIKDGKFWWILWAVVDQEVKIMLPQTPSQVLDVFGENLLPQQEINLTRAPIYLLFP